MLLTIVFFILASAFLFIQVFREPKLITNETRRIFFGMTVGFSIPALFCMLYDTMPVLGSLCLAGMFLSFSGWIFCLPDTH